MAQKVEITLVDDLDGGVADNTVNFGLDGKSYEIDLNETNEKALRDALEPFIGAGRKMKPPARGGVQTSLSVGGASKVSRSKANDETAKIRAWAEANGYEVNKRGRISVTIREAYLANRPASGAMAQETASEVPEGQEAIQLEPPVQEEPEVTTAPTPASEPAQEPEKPQAAEESTAPEETPEPVKKAPAKKTATRRTSRKKTAPKEAPQQAQS